MILRKNDIVYNLTDIVQIDAFLKSGWVEIDEFSQIYFKPPLNAMTDEELRNYAAENNIVIPQNVTKKETIINLILQHKQNQ